MIPVVAAMIVPMMVTDRAKPPGVLRKRTCRQYSKSLATPDRSSMVPMNMNIGTATRIRLSAALPQILETMLKYSMKLKTPK